MSLPLAERGRSLRLRTASTMASEAEIFSLKMELQAIRARNSLLEGCSDAEQLSEALLEREQIIGNLSKELGTLKGDLVEARSSKLESDDLKEQKERLEGSLATEQQGRAAAVQKLLLAEERLTESERAREELQSVVERLEKKYEEQAEAAASASALASNLQRAQQQAEARVEELETRVAGLIDEAKEREESRVARDAAARKEAAVLKERLRDAAANEGARVKAAAEERTKQLKEQVSKAVREKDALRAEVGKLRHQNQELREKVVRQDAAWKRKIERERKNGRGGYVLESGSAGAAQRVKLGSRDKENKAAAASNQQSSSSSSSSHLKTEKPRPNANAQTSKKGSDSNNNCVAAAQALSAKIATPVPRQQQESSETSSMAWA